MSTPTGNVGFFNGTMGAYNADFSSNGEPLAANGLQLDGQIWIGRTAVNAGGTHIDVGTLTAGTGISITNGPGSITIANSSPATSNTITGDTGGALTPNWSILGQQAGSVAVMDTVGTGPSTLRVEDRAWQTQLIVDPSATVGLRGTFSTITLALAAAVSGQTIFLRPGTYTENFSLKAGVNICGWPSDGVSGSLVQSQFTPNVKIVGKMSFSAAGFVVISNVFLQTNSDNILAVTGTAASNVLFKNCYLYASNATAIVSSSTLSNISILNCNGDLGTTGIAYFALSGGGNLGIEGGTYGNSGSSLTASTWSAGILSVSNCGFSSFITSSGSSAAGANIYNVVFNIGALNTTILTLGNSSGQQISMWNCQLFSGTASAINISHASASLFLDGCEIDSTNTNSVTGTGSIELCVNTFTNTSSIINTTTQTYDYSQLGKYKAHGQPCFSAYGNSADTGTNVTGDGTTYTVPFSAEQFDQNSNYASNTFTAPVTGRYHFDYGVLAQQVVATMGCSLTLTIGGTSAEDYLTTFGTTGTGNYAIWGSRTVPMTAGDTAQVQINFSGGTKVVDIYSADGDPRTYFSGYLVA